MNQEVKQFTKELEQQILFHYLHLDYLGRFVNAPKTDDELDEFILLAYGVRFPKKVLTQGHRSSFQFVSDLYFERVKNALGFASRAAGKCLALDTWVLTTNGFVQLQNISVGDFVFAPDGTPTRVSAISDVFTDHECYRLTIDKESFVADADHLWEVVRVQEDDFQILSSSEIYDVVQNSPKIGYKAQFRIDKCSPIMTSQKSLPVHPYVLGYYLGNGCRYNNMISTADDEIIEHLCDLHDGKVTEYSVAPGKCPNFALGQLRWRLREAGMPYPKPHTEKVVPAEYLLGSYDQRLELLRGLMDSDGYIRASRGSCEFDSKDYNLAQSVKFLVASLGGNATLYCRGPGKLNGREYSDMFRVGFYPESSWNPFWLSRKAECVLPLRFNNHHKLLSIEKVETVPVKCLRVEHPSSMFLIGQSLIRTHNTFAVALVNHLDMLFKPNCEVASAGAVKDQADKCYRYFCAFNKLPWFKRVHEQFLVTTNRPLLISSIKSYTEFGNGSRLEIITGSEKGFRGPHPQKARIDEIDELPWDVFQTGLSMAASGHGIRGQNVFTSTRQKPDGAMQRLLDEANDKGITIYEWNCWEMIERCPRRCVADPKFGDCPIHTFCRGKAHSSDGFYKIDDFVDKVRLIDRDKFETEWLNLRPSRHKAVFPMFNPNRHILSPDGFKKLTGRSEPSLAWTMLSGIDFGSSPGHPFVYGKYFRMPNGAWVVWYEYLREQALLRDHANVITNSPFYRSNEWCFADWDAQDRVELRLHGVNTRPAVKGPSSVNVSIDYIASLLRGFPPREEPMLYVMDWCSAHIKEFKIYEWPVRPDGKPDKTGRPLSENDHAMSSLRYALYSYHKQGATRYHGGQRKW